MNNRVLIQIHILTLILSLVGAVFFVMSTAWGWALYSMVFAAAQGMFVDYYIRKEET